jgi:hypothetical protein
MYVGKINPLMAGHEILEIARLGSKQRICWDLSILYVMYTFTQHIYLNTQEVSIKVFFYLLKKCQVQLIQVYGVFDKLFYYRAAVQVRTRLRSLRLILIN